MAKRKTKAKKAIKKVGQMKSGPRKKAVKGAIKDVARARKLQKK